MVFLLYVTGDGCPLSPMIAARRRGRRV